MRWFASAMLVLTMLRCGKGLTAPRVEYKEAPNCPETWVVAGKENRRGDPNTVPARCGRPHGSNR